MGEVTVLRTQPDREAAGRRELLGRLIRQVRGELTQLEFAATLGLKQPAISAWEAGKVGLSVEQLHAIESSLGLQHGWLSVASGYVDSDVDPLMVLLEASVGALPNATGRG